MDFGAWCVGGSVLMVCCIILRSMKTDIKGSRAALHPSFEGVEFIG